MILDNKILPLILFQFLPEVAIVSALSLLLVGYKIRLKQVVMIGIIGTLLVSVIKSLHLLPIVSTLIMAFVLIVLITVICKIDIVSAAIAIFVGIVVLGLVETANYFLFNMATGITMQQAMADLTLRLLFPLPEYIFLILLILFCQKYNFALVNLKELKELSRKDYER